MCDREESLFYVDTAASGALVDPDEALVAAEKHGLLAVDLALFWRIEHDVELVGHEANHAVPRRTAAHLVEPQIHILEGLEAGDVAHDDHTVGAPVVVLGYRAVPLAPCCVPKLQIDCLTVVKLDQFRCELDTDCRFLFTSFTMYELVQNARLAREGVPCEHDFEQVVVVALVIRLEALVFITFTLRPKHCYRLRFLNFTTVPSAASLMSLKEAQIRE